MILKLGMKHQGEELYKVYINHDLGVTLTYFIYPSSQVSVYRTIGPLVWTCFPIDTANAIYLSERPKMKQQNMVRVL